MNAGEYAPKGPYVLLPIETKAREFLAKILLGCVAAENGFHVVLGDQNEIHRYLGYLPRGIYIDKSIVRTKIRSFQKNRRIGNRVVAWCEEGLSFRVPETYLKERISRTAFSLTDRFYAWGPYHQGLLRQKLQEGPEKIVSAGNPRFDLLLSPYRRVFEPEVEALKGRFGAFILVNTNFSRYNHYYGRDFVIRNLKEAGRVEDEAHEWFLEQWADYLGEMYRHFGEMVGKISKAFPGFTVIVRPHPSESQESWKEKTRSLPNVRVIHEGNVIPWIMASEVMIQNSCTTGVEAFIMEEPVIAYRPIVSKTYDSYLPNAICPTASSPDALISMIDAFVRKKAPDGGLLHRDEASQDLVRQYISGLNGTTACEHVVRGLLRVLEGHPELREQERQTGLSGLVTRAAARAVALKRSMVHLVRGSRGLRAYMRQKFPGLELAEAQQAVSIFQRATSGFEDIRVFAFPGTSSCFLVTRTDSRDRSRPWT